MHEKITFQHLIDEFLRLQEAEKLLKQVYADIGPYKGAVSDKTRQDICQFYKFDDSE